MALFALVHGAWHGAWCFDDLRTHLEQRGHDSVAIDLPCEDATAGCEVYAGLVADTIRGGDAVVVGHSLAGLTVPLVAEQVPVRGLIYLAALLPRVGASLRDQLGDSDPLPVVQDRFDLEYDEQQRHRWPRFETACASLFQDCDPAVARAAFDRLRWQGTRPMTDPYPLDHLPSVPSAYIVCSDDQNVSPVWGRRAARERLGVEPAEVAAGHSPFLSRTSELADLLVELEAALGNHHGPD